MKLLLFSDLHADVAAARQLVSMAGDIDVLVGAGDFANVRRNISDCVDVILNECRAPSVFVPGNNETFEELKQACRGHPHANVLHGTECTIGKVRFFGLGGGVPVTPFGSWSFDLSEDEAEKLLKPCPEGCVLVTHSPPFGAVDVSSSGKSLGSQAVRRAIERCRPALCVCGHIHASGGQRAQIGRTPIVNAGPRGVRWTLGAEGTSSCPSSPSLA